jgi:DNA repair exonuclease SbcCD ATPase subunit
MIKKTAATRRMPARMHWALGAALALTLALAAMPAAQAQNQGFQKAGPGGAAANGASPEMQALVGEYRELVQELARIRKKAMQANPELTEQQQAFQKMVQSEMVEAGFDAEARGPKLNQLAQQLKSEELSEEKRTEITQEIQQNRMAFAKARQQALSQPQVQETASELQTAVIAAMKEQNGKTEQLLARLETIKSDLQSQMPQNTPG